MDHPGSILDQFMIFDFLEAQPGAGTGLILDQARGSAWTRHGAQPGPGMGLSLDQARGSAWTRHGLFGAHLGPIWGPILREAFRGIGWGPGTHLEAEG